MRCRNIELFTKETAVIYGLKFQVLGDQDEEFVTKEILDIIDVKIFHKVSYRNQVSYIDFCNYL